MTFRGGNEQAREKVREALVSYFENTWDEVVVELTHDGSRWRIDLAWAKPAGGGASNPGSWDCSERVVNALVLGGAMSLHEPRLIW